MEGGNPNADHLDRAVGCARVVFLICLLSLASTLGSATYYFLIQAEADLANSHYESIAEQTITGVRKLVEQKRWAAMTVAAMVSENFPNASVWPFVSIVGFERIVANILHTGSGAGAGVGVGTGTPSSSNTNGTATATASATAKASATGSIAFMPIVQPEQLEEWERYILNFYENVRNPPIPSHVTTSSFGQGVWAVNTQLDQNDNSDTNPDKRYRDTGDSTPYNSPNKILTPLAQVSEEYIHAAILFNVHFESSRGRLMDQILECSSHSVRAKITDGPTQLDIASEKMEEICSGITTMVPFFADASRGPSSSIYVPIYPANNPNMVVGFISTLIVWDELLRNTFSKHVNGIHCILETDLGQIYTYEVSDGIARPIGHGDHHQTKYSSFAAKARITHHHHVYEANSPVYTITLYPTDEWYAVFSTSNPRVAMFGSICVMLVTSIFFWLYDSLVRRKLMAKKGLLDAKRKFMRFVSHEVRTPLNSVCMGISVLQQDIAASLGYESSDKLRDITNYAGPTTLGSPPTTESQTKRSEQIEWFKLTEDVLRHTQIAVDVLSDLLHYDKIESGTLTMEREVVPIWHLIETSLKEFKLPALKKNIDLRLDFAECLKTSNGECVQCLRDSSSIPQAMRKCTVQGDAARLTQVLRNLLSNAVKFSPENGKITIRASCERPKSCSSPTPALKCKTPNGTGNRNRNCSVGNGDIPIGFLKVAITDTGVGIAKDQLSTLFREGVQFNAAALQEGKGSGLGLYISKGIVDLHGGRLEATSSGLGHGSTFTVRLPMYDAPCQSENATNQEDPALGSPVVTTSLDLLVVDDSISNRKLLGRLLTRAGHSCDLAEDGAEALAMVLEKQKADEYYDSILLDYEMPVMTGPEAAIAIRNAGSDVHIVGITGNVLPDDVAHFMSCGANAVLPKPVKLPDLSKLWHEHGVLLHGKR